MGKYTDLTLGEMGDTKQVQLKRLTSKRYK